LKASASPRLNIYNTATKQWMEFRLHLEQLPPQARRARAITTTARIYPVKSNLHSCGITLFHRSMRYGDSPIKYIPVLKSG
jgi:hypothetical protein